LKTGWCPPERIGIADAARKLIPQVIARMTPKPGPIARIRRMKALELRATGSRGRWAKIRNLRRHPSALRDTFFQERTQIVFAALTRAKPLKIKRF
jgi:hypothetical protein